MKKDNNRGMKDWSIFIHVIEAGSLSQAAKDLNISVAAVSKSVSRLESFVEASLVRRDSRRLELTCAGEIAYNGAKDITAALHALLESLRNPDCTINGQIKFCAPAILCEFLANYWVLDYSKIHSEARVILFAREGGDFERNSPEFDDLVFMSGYIESEDLIYRRLNPVKLVLCASPGYLDGLDPIYSPADLESHALLGVRHHWLGNEMMLTCNDENYLLSMSKYSSVFSNNTLALLNLAVSGDGGITLIPSLCAEPFIDAGLLKVVLPNWQVPEMPVYLVWRHRKFYSPLFKNFANFIEEKWNALSQPDFFGAYC